MTKRNKKRLPNVKDKVKNIAEEKQTRMLQGQDYYSRELDLLAKTPQRRYGRLQSPLVVPVTRDPSEIYFGQVAALHGGSKKGHMARW